MHTAAREMVYVAEQGLMADGKNTLDPTWQEMLNHATSKVIKHKTGGLGINRILLLLLSPLINMLISSFLITDAVAIDFFYMCFFNSRDWCLKQKLRAPPQSLCCAVLCVFAKYMNANQRY